MHGSISVCPSFPKGGKTCCKGFKESRFKYILYK
ncbi:hypothetical protein M8C21_023008 [Ambrosia artemisiifolia]|uniref:Uncharacterized protein n=1 Tax=Ambrosia artemisiifolia TaxID=4212 RepID=A0AAD5CYD2_AMBAR|nr:hypothetical protein M8C21_023008 [Ambrosia artemisiifolia]